MSDQLKKLVAILSSIAIGVGVFMPFLGINIFGNSISLMLIKASDTGLLVLFAAIIALVNSVIGPNTISAICGAVAAIVVLIQSFNVSDKIAERAGISANITSSMLQKGPGFYCMLIASIILVVFSLIPTNDN